MFRIFFVNNYYYQTIYLFLGLIIGTFISFIPQVKFNYRSIIIALISFIFVLSLSFLSTNSLFIFQGKVSHYLYTIFLGFIDALTSIVPGISGTAIYLLLGSYEYVLSILSKPHSFIFMLYLVGVILGVIIISFIMNYLFKKRRNTIYSVILGFMGGSLILLLLSTINNFKLYLLLFLVIGIFLGVILAKNK